MAKKGSNKIEKPKNALKVLNRIFKYLFEYKLYLFFVFISIIFASLARVVVNAFLKKIIDNYIIPLSKQYNQELMQGFITILFIIGIVYFVGTISAYIFRRIMLFLSTTTLYKIREELFTKMEMLPLKYFDTKKHGDLMSIYSNDIDALRNMLSETFASCIFDFINITGIFVMMIYYSWELTTIIVFMLIIILFSLKYITKKSREFFLQQQKELGKINGFIEEMIEGQKVIKVFCHENKSKLDFETLNERLRFVSTEANSYANIMMPIMTNLSNINYALISIAGAILIILNIISLGTLISFLQYTRSFFNPIAGISQQFNSILVALAGAERIFEVIDERPEIDDGKITLINAKINDNGEIIETKDRSNIWAWKEDNNGKIIYRELKGEIIFKNVLFKYDNNKVILNTINIQANMGEQIALVGSIGAGKTTITNLINRFYDIQQGEILFDGINIKNIKKSDLRKTISIVLQDTHLFTGSVIDNIRYGKLNATDDEIISACKLANADYFINNLPDGYNTILTADANNLSQGERQLLAIARAILADPPILILDEATSSIDTRTERLIEEGMQTLMKGRTVFIIAHRLSTVRNSQNIIVLENGTVLESGNHNELLDKKGRYYQLYNGMFELE